MRNLILTSFTSINSPGGVPHWNRDFIKCFPKAKHYSWADFDNIYNMSYIQTEYEKSCILNHWLINTGRRSENDIVIGDGWWAGNYFSKNTISVCHGIWSHLIKEEADTGKQPDFPYKHTEQITYRKNHLANGGRLISVSEFIKHQMEIQWEYKSDVINNAINLDEFKPPVKKITFDKQLIIHGINDKGNKNKGWDHIEYLNNNIDAYIMSLDEAVLFINKWIINNDRSGNIGYMNPLTKYEVLGHADLVVAPSGFEGNSYFSLECLASNIPIVAYDVGLFFELGINKFSDVGIIENRKLRDKEIFCHNVKSILSNAVYRHNNSRDIAKNYSIQKFYKQWKDYLKKKFDYEQ